jgi:hypothetical protein
MKNLFLIIFLAICASAKADMQTLNIPSSTNAVFATSTNLNAGSGRTLPEAVTGGRIYVEFTGTAATTNGTYTVFFQTGRFASSNFWDSATNSNIKVSVPCQGVTNCNSAWFNFVGIPAVRSGIEINTSQGIATNLSYKIVFPSKLNQ